MVESMISIFPENASEFSLGALGGLTDAIACQVVEERNGQFELSLRYPVKGAHFDQIALRRIIASKSNPYSKVQAFRIYEISKPINGIVDISAEHISYDLSGYPVSPFSATGVSAALNSLPTNSPLACPFTFGTDKTTGGHYELKTPSSIRSQLGGVEGSILDIFGGEYEFDNFNVILHNARGLNRGVKIEYGKNLTDFQKVENSSSVYTGVYPYWSGTITAENEIEDPENPEAVSPSNEQEEVYIELPEKIVNGKANLGFTKIMPLDLSGEFQDPPTFAQLRRRAKSYMTQNNLFTPKVTYSVSFLQLKKSNEYDEFSVLERIQLCDTVNVIFPLYGTNITEKCTRTVYDAITDRYISIDLGYARDASISEMISVQQREIEEIPSPSLYLRASEKATKLITGGSGGYVLLHSSTGRKEPDEILVLDQPSIETATKVWRWNKNGLGFSPNGYQGPYSVAATIDGQIVADFITAGTLSGDRLRVGSVAANALDPTIASFIANGTLWMDFDPSGNGLIIGKNGSRFKVQITNDTLYFLENGTAVAYMNNQKLFITNGEFMTTLQIGRTGSGSEFAFIPRSNNSLDFKYVGSQ